MQPTFYERASPIASKAIGMLPLAPPNTVLALLLKRIARRHQDILERLEPIAGKTFAIEITDLSLIVFFKVGNGAITAKFVRQAPEPDVVVTGTLPLLTAMVEGEVDGDALFFTRDLTISGDTEALLTLRNALDSADFSLQREILSAAGPIGTVLSHAKRALGGPHHRAQNSQSGHPS